jgi:hypothetical protein
MIIIPKRKRINIANRMEGYHRAGVAARPFTILSDFSTASATGDAERRILGEDVLAGVASNFDPRFGCWNQGVRTRSQFSGFHHKLLFE